MAESELEVQVTRRVREAVRSAVEKVGRNEFSSISGLNAKELEGIFEEEGAYVKVVVVSLACQVNKSHGDPDIAHSSISECLKGAIYRMPGQATQAKAESRSSRRVSAEDLKQRRTAPALFDPKSIRILNFSANTAGFLILGYFLGGIALGPLFGIPQCVGLTATSPWIAPCLGSGLGLVAGSVVGLVYTYYYFVKKL